MRRGFTLLETVMAAAIGLVVVVTAVGIMTAMTRADTILAKRSEQVAQLQIIHGVMSRSFTTLAMSDAPPPKAPPGSRGFGAPGGSGASDRSAPTRPEDAAESSAKGARPDIASLLASTGRSLPPGVSVAGGSVTRSGAKPVVTSATDAEGSGASEPEASAGPVPPEPRLVLALAEDQSAPMLLRQTGDRADKQAASQRLEVVLSKPPVQYPKTTGATQLPSDSPEVDAAQVVTKSFRGIFELLPDPTSPRNLGDEPAPRSFSLWWRPLPAPALATGTPRSDAAPTDGLPPPVRIAGNLAFCQWQAFHNLEPRSQYSAVWAQDLPAYIMMEVQTVNGLYANWMFEVDWVVQPETEKASSSVNASGVNDAASKSKANTGSESAGRPNARTSGAATQEPSPRAAPKPAGSSVRRGGT